jgi:cell wall-associated NlpC family hydrolase
MFLFFSVTDTEAARRKKSKHRSKHKRSYNPNKTRAQAIDIIRNSSEEISELAGLQPNVTAENAELQKLINNDEGEILTTDGDLGENIEELEAEDDVTVDLEQFKMLWLSFIDNDSNGSMTASGIPKSDLMYVIMDWLGTPYRFGGTTRGNIDCSGFTQKIFLAAADIMLPRVAREQVNLGNKVNMKNLQFGDLVFFHTYSRRFASHVGIYLGDNLFAHASSRYGVTVSSLESSYYNKHFIGGRRLNSRDIAKLSINSGTQLNATGNPSKGRAETGK